MHIPNAFLGPEVRFPAAMGAGAMVIWAARRAQRDLPPDKVPLPGPTAAFIFAAQIVNFPVARGTSGHLLGGVLAAALLAPHAAVVAMTAIPMVQAPLFRDGGVTALGANVIKMAVVSAYAGWPVAPAIMSVSRLAASRIGAVGGCAPVSVAPGVALSVVG